MNEYTANHMFALNAYRSNKGRWASGDPNPAEGIMIGCNKKGSANPTQTYK